MNKRLNCEYETTGSIIQWLLDSLDSIEGKKEISIQRPRRTPKQNKLMHALFSDVTSELIAIGHSFTVCGIRTTPTVILIKEMFKIAYLGGKNTRDATTSELTDAIDKFCFDMNENFNISISIKNT